MDERVVEGGAAVVSGPGDLTSSLSPDARAVDTPPPRPGDLVGGRFLLRRPIGSGGSATVFEAFDVVLRTPVALKILRSGVLGVAERARLSREVRLARPGHENLVTIHDVHPAGESAVLSMELVEGRSLRAHLAERKRLPVDETVAIGRQVAGALAYLAHRGLVHRDVKPANILLNGAGAVKLCDLGLVRPVLGGETVTGSAGIVGTPTYMAPEQGLGRRLTPAVDVYALGLTLWECLTGEVPLKGDTPLETLLARQKARPAPLRKQLGTCPRWLERLLSQMLEPRPEDRPSPAEVERALARRSARLRLKARSALATAAVVTAATLAVLVAGRALRPEVAARVEAHDRSVSGFDARGRLLFRHDLASPIIAARQADLDADGRPETIVSAFAQGSSPRRPNAEVAVVTPRGEVLTSIQVEDLLSPWPHPVRRQVTALAEPADLDGDGRPELLVNYHHFGSYPSGLLAFWPRQRRWEWLLDHTGKLEHVSVNPGSSPSLRLLGMNNKLGMQLVAMAISLEPASARTTDVTTGATLAVGPRASGTRAGATLLAYTFLGEPPVTTNGGPPTIGASSAGIGVRGGYGDFDLDARWNPVPGPNAGRDLRDLRLAFVRGLPESAASPGSDDRVAAELAAAERTFAPLLAEAPYLGVLNGAFARRFLEAGSRARAIALLQRAADVLPTEDLRYRLAGALALDGRADDAVRILTELSETAHTPRGNFDAPLALFRLAAAERRAGDAQRAMAILVDRYHLLETQPMLPPVLWAWARLLQDAATESDGTVRECLYAPDGDAVAALVRWRLKASQAGDVASMRTLADAGTEAAREAGLALAAAQISEGRPGEAHATLEALIRRLEGDAAWDYWSRLLLDVARGLRAQALLRAGKPGSAETAARELLHAAPSARLAVNLAREVLQETARSRP